MKGPWLRGLLLGVSLTLLLSGGVALAQSLTVEPDCFQCWPGTPNQFLHSQPGYPYSYTWDSCGWAPGAGLVYTERFLATGEVAYTKLAKVPQDGCVGSDGAWGWACDGEPLHHRSQATANNGEYVWPDDYWGSMRICLESEGNADASASARVCRNILFAETCPALEEEFVPEPGSLALLGSGLLGLAGYAALRLRTRS
jgi:hypothetical protein